MACGMYLLQNASAAAYLDKLRPSLQALQSPCCQAFLGRGGYLQRAVGMLSAQLGYLMVWGTRLSHEE